MAKIVKKTGASDLWYESPTVEVIQIAQDVVQSSTSITEGGAEDNADWWS